MKRLIELDSEKRRLIKKTYGASSAVISYALRFRRNNKRSIAIRAMALELGGKLYEESNKET